MEKAGLEESKFLRVKIVHEKVTDLVDHGSVSLTPGRTWKVHKVNIDWNITRPETGEIKQTMACPSCGKILEIQVYSSTSIALEVKKFRKVAISGAIACLLLGLAIVMTIYFRLMGLLRINTSDEILVYSGIGFAISLIALVIGWANVTQDSWGLRGNGDLKNSKVIGPYSQHYLETVESQ